MFGESDNSEAIRSGEQAEPVQLEANEAARRQVLEYNESLLNCEHAQDAAAEASAVDRSAQIMEGWEKTNDPVLREKLLDRVGREMMNVHEAPPAPIYWKEMPDDELGAYQDDDFRMDINEHQLEEDNPRDALETYLHEYRHIEQNYEAQKSRGALGHSVDQARAAAVGYNLESAHYIDGREDPKGYAEQLIETDAERFGTTTAKEILERREELQQEHDLLHGSDADRIARMRLTTERGSRS